MQSTCAILSSVACPALHYLYSSHKLHDFFGGGLLNIKGVFRFSLQLLSEKFLILRRIHQDMIKNVYRSSCIVTVILVRV